MLLQRWLFSLSIVGCYYSCCCAMVVSPPTTVDKVLLQQFLTMSRAIGPIGVFATTEQQQELEELAKQLQSRSDLNPATQPLFGIHNLVYSSAPGGSSGRLVGPIYGTVSQEFLTEDTFINTVQCGPLELSLMATKSVLSDCRNKVTFQESTVKLFGQTIVQKEIKGGGVWDYIFMGEVMDTDGSTKLIRVMKTPSLFVLEQKI